jgi:glucose/arabinose dehydrogenase
MIRRTTLVAALTALALTAAACASDGGETDSSTPGSGPDITLGTVPDPEATPTEPPTTEPATTDSGSVTADTVPTPSTTMLTPSPDADLPTQAPSDVQVAPVTTLPGPLPVPSARLLELGAYDRPIDIITDPRDTRLFVVQKNGSIVAADDESDVVVFDIADVVDATFTSDGGEQGLLGLAFHPEENLAYVNFTDGDGNTVVAEFAFDPDTYVFDPTSYREVLTVEQPFGNHNGGDLAFGPDGYLYIGLGDGGSADDPNRTALDPSSRLGKILRIDPLPTPTAPFAVPDDNPFVGIDGADPTIWSLGLRNPWRFSFDSLTGDLWIGDVGQNRLEEINKAAAVDGRDAGRGVSFGWSAFEADERFNEDQSPDGHTLPITSYPHDDGNCSVSGGVVARSSSFQELNGWYVYGDYCSGRIWALDTTSVASGPNGPVGTPTIVQLGTVPALAALAEGPFGDIYAVSNTGPTYRLAPA